MIFQKQHRQTLTTSKEESKVVVQAYAANLHLTMPSMDVDASTNANTHSKFK